VSSSSDELQCLVVVTSYSV